MGISRATARLLLREYARMPFAGSVLQLGRQDVFLAESQLREDVLSLGLKPQSISKEWNSEAGTENDLGCLSDRRFFRLLGFDKVLSCDVSAYEDAEILLDLNQPVPPSLYEHFDLVFNGGTTEHVFNVPTVLSNVHSLLKVGGRAIHVVPASNLVDHGFYSFSPTFFCDYYHANNYQVSYIYLFTCFDWTSKWTVYEYAPGRLDDKWGKIANSKKMGIFCVVQKTSDSRCDIVPSQSYYQRLWLERPLDRQKSYAAPFKTYLKTHLPSLCEPLFWVRTLARHVFQRDKASVLPLVGKF